MTKPIGNQSFNRPHKDKVSHKLVDRFGPQPSTKPEPKEEESAKPKYKVRKKK
ncbi:MAG: hypothetical protein NTW19_16585 [Planctomycetota bacterium]|nr:hypothetical protein [Planctomycetota bacterium]